MGNCKFCGKPAGFLMSAHRDCGQQHDEEVRHVFDLIDNGLRNSDPAYLIAHQAKNIVGAPSLLSDAERLAVCTRAWESTVQKCLHDGVLTEDQENKLVQLADQLELPRAELERNGSWAMLVKSAVIRDLLNDVVPHRMTIDGTFNLNLQSKEKIVWAFQAVRYLEDRVHKEYVGGSRGVSVRIAKGVYYRAGSFRGHSVEHTTRDLVDIGLMAVTNKHVYFAGPKTTLRIPFTKVVAFQAYNDGLGLVRDGAKAKPQVFATGDGWFTYNLVTNVARLA